MQKVILSILLAFGIVVCFAQSISPVVINSTGSVDYMVNGTYIETSIGEVVVQTLAPSSGYATIGLLQPSYSLTTEIENISADNSIRIYPNPTEGVITIFSAIEIIKSLILFDELGRQILNFDSNQNVLDVSNIAKGIYFLHIENDKQQTNIFKIIKF